jgi:hypothetical protein
MLLVTFKTLQKSEDIRDYTRQITGSKITDLTTTRVLFKKVAKGLDDKDFVIIQQERRIK